MGATYGPGYKRTGGYAKEVSSVSAFGERWAIVPDIDQLPEDIQKVYLHEWKSMVPITRE
jgi:hypothetical protein